jgi:hypothetical protein
MAWGLVEDDDRFVGTGVTTRLTSSDPDSFVSFEIVRRDCKEMMLLLL